MGRRRKIGRPLDGVLLLDKPLGVSSNSALQTTKRLFFAQKAGHTGSLDPLATGVLPICFGEATKYSQHMLDADKTYRATIRLGAATTSGDLEGDLLGETDTSHLDETDINTAIATFRGDISQVPSMFSALKYKGTPLYELARKGVEVERPARAVTIHRFVLLSARLGKEAEIDVEIACSKGTYIRTIAEDLGIALGVGGHLTALHRTAVGSFSEEGAHSIDALKERRGDGDAEQLDSLLLPVDVFLEHYASVELDQASAEFFMLGQAVMVPGVYRFAKETDIVRTLSDAGSFLGIGEVTGDGKVTPRRVIAQQQ